MLLFDRRAYLLDEALGELPLRLDRRPELSWLHRSELLDQRRSNRSCHGEPPFGSERVTANVATKASVVKCKSLHVALFFELAAAAQTHAPHVQGIARQPDDQEQKDEARPGGRVADLAAFSMKENAGSHGGSDQECDQELRCGGARHAE